jgi:hypothetical protein
MDDITTVIDNLNFVSCEKSLKVICLLGEERISFWCMVHHLSGCKDSREKTNEQSKIVFRYKIF